MLLCSITIQNEIVHAEKKCSRPGSNRGPSVCETDVITTTPRELLLTSEQFLNEFKNAFMGKGMINVPFK